ncbi:MAG: CHAP domain-containing protein [Candidatus Peribacteria bacterium]|nr:MAG: CHAP domain-containing protein [Candidatus Peribacteria bacterium]
MLLVEAPQEEIPEPEVIAAIPAPEEQLQDTRPEILPSEQVVISAEETDQHLKSLGKEEPTPEESSSLCGENKCELNGKCFTKPENAICSTEVQGNAWACKEGFEEKGRSCVAIPQAPVSLCPDNQCELNGKCYNKPDNASCDANSKDNAWVCNEGFEEKGRSCVALPQAAKPVEKAAEPKPAETPKTTEPEEAKIVTLTPKTTSSSNGSKDEEIVSQWYFNPRKAGFGGDGWGGGHCTEYAAYYWWKNYDISLRQYIRGNAGQWYDNAANAGLSVGQTPSVGAIIVMKFGSSGWSSYGHVGIVTEVDLTNRMVRIQDANFMGRYIVTDHWVDMDSEDNPII